MAKAYLNLIKAALKDGFIIDVNDREYDGEGYRGTAYKRIKDDVEALDGGAHFTILKANGERIASVGVAIGYGNADEETVADWATKPDSEGDVWMDDWFAWFNKTHPY